MYEKNIKLQLISLNYTTRNQSLTPIFLRNVSIRHQLVNADCNRLAPTNAVNHAQLGFTKYASSKLIKTKLPAMPFIYLSIMMLNFICYTFFQAPNGHPSCLYKLLYRKNNRLHGIVAFDFFVELIQLIQQNFDLVLLLKSEEQHGLYLVI